jgi:alpha-amylase/alpha-mannosidase (GH57 family)
VSKIKIALLWHMHQPFYKDPYSKKIALPWVRLHGLKDYYGMVAILKNFPKIKATYNLVPSLLTQLESYLRGETDIFRDMFLKDAQTLKKDEIYFLIRHFFSANYDNHIKPWPGYRYLHDKKAQHQRSGDTHWKKVFSVDELRDLQVWFQLTHFDEEYKQKDGRVKHLIQKGHHFTEADKKIVEEVELEILAKIIPAYRKYLDPGQIEISTTPFYHPILPLLIDPQEGRIANPDLPEYDLHFNWKEDAVFQLESGLTYMEKIFGKRPVGIWPSEGSLSGDVLSILDDLGICWTATDETILGRSLDIPIERDKDFHVKNPDILYKPYVLKGGNIKIFFRDRHFSDLVGFHYQKMSYDRAAQDLVARIKQVPLPSNRDIVVPIILDGENAWEYYPGSGRDFLQEFFRLITEDETLETVTFSEAADAKLEIGELRQFSSGSWINGNFDIWIGDDEDRIGWKLLEITKNALEESEADLSAEQKREIREYISIAQGSDWFWWFGEENYTPDLDIFDNLFRKNLRKVYDILGKKIPDEFSAPVFSRASRRKGIRIIPPVRPIHPRLDGRVGSHLEWLHAGRIDAAAIGGAMNIANPLVNRIYYGFDIHNFYLRVDTKADAAQYFENGYSLDIVIKDGKMQERFSIDPAGAGTKLKQVTIVVDGIIEMCIPLGLLNLGGGSIFYLQLEWKYDGEYFQAIPFNDYFKLTVPLERDYACFWVI